MVLNGSLSINFMIAVGLSSSSHVKKTLVSYTSPSLSLSGAWKTIISTFQVSVICNMLGFQGFKAFSVSASQPCSVFSLKART